MQYLEESLTFDDVLLSPAHSQILPRDANLHTQLCRGITLKIPVVSSAMDTVTEARLAIALAQEGGIGILHKNMSITDQVEEAIKVKKFESGIVKSPIVVHPNHSIKEVKQLKEQYQISGMPVVDQGVVVGIITNRDTRFVIDLEQPVANLMTPKEKLVTVSEGASSEVIRALLHQHRIEKLLVVNKEGALKGLITVKDILKARKKPLASKDKLERLRVGAAVGTTPETLERVAALLEVGIDLIVVDTAHGHSQGVLDQVARLKKHYPSLPVIGGNIATVEAARALADCGADGVKVGMGPGSICTTRIVSGVGVPQITAISSVAKALEGTGIPVIADGGIRYSGDIGKAIVAGASTVMIGSLFAGTEEAPGEKILYQGRSYKTYRGMGSVGAMTERYGSRDRYFQDDSLEVEKLVPEGIEGRIPYKGFVYDIINQLIGGLRSCMGYTGCCNIMDLQNKAHFIKVSSAAKQESHVHDVIITKEAPNYSLP